MKDDQPTIGTLLIINGTDRTAGIKLQDLDDKCGRQLWKTQLDNVLVLFTDGKKKLDLPLLNPLNVDLEVAMEATGAYLYQHVGNNINKGFAAITMAICMKQREIIKLKLAMVRNHPEEVELLGLKEKGYLAALTGDTLSVIKCKNVTGDVALRVPDGKCYTGLPLTYKGGAHFRDPRTHALVRFSEEVPCDSDGKYFGHT